MTIKEILQFALERHQTGNFKQAEQWYKKVLKKQPNNFDALHMLGVLCSQIGNHNAAIQFMEKALTCNPNSFYAYFNLGNIFSELKQYDKAMDYYQKAIQRKADYSDAYYRLGNTFEHMGQLQKAIDCYQKVLVINPHNFHAHYTIGNILLQKGHFDKAVLYFQKVVQLSPNFAEAYNNLGCAFQQKNQLDQAIDNYKKAVHINPNYASAYSNLGSAFIDEGKVDEAIPYLLKALQIDPVDANAYNNLGNIYKEKGDFHNAVQCYQKAIKRNPNLAEAHFNTGCLLLLSGNFEEGWREYEWRRDMKYRMRRSFSQLMWDGSDIKNRTILIHAEQGFGDTIQFIRYIPLVKQRAATVVVECQKELFSLIQHSTGIHQLIVTGEQLPSFDIHCPLLSVPLVLGDIRETIPAKIPYISVDSMLIRKWNKKLQSEHSELKVGLVWLGRSTHKGDRYRSINPEKLLPLVKIDGITFYSLQKGDDSRETEAFLDSTKIIDVTREITDFSDTAALIQNLDLVISVDTAVAHLTGALGKSIWTLIPFVPDWRWMLNRADSLWYPTMRLFRQPSPGDWDSVITSVKDALWKLLDN